MTELTAEIARNLIKELKETVPDIKVNVEYYLNLQKAQELIKDATQAEKTTEIGEETYLVKSHEPQYIVAEVPIVATLDVLEVYYGKPRAGFTIHQNGEAHLGYNKNKHTDKVVEILESYKIPIETDD